MAKDYNQRQKLPFAKAYFKKYNINIDLSKIKNTQADEIQAASDNEMLGVISLKYTVDSLTKSYNKEIISVADNTYQRMGINAIIAPDSIRPQKPKTPELTSFLTLTEKAKIIEIASSDALSSKQNFEINNSAMDFRKKIINNYWLSIYDKFVIACACILMFFIGAPLGAIIRKGGLGLPIVFAMLIFITFHFLNTFGKKLAQESGITPFLGAWISFFVLVPLAVFLTKKAINDNGDVNFDIIPDPIKKIFNKLTQQKKS